MKNATRKKTTSASVSRAPANFRVEIKKRAYEIWLNDGGGHGNDLDHWLRAERELAGQPLEEQRVTLT